jgi:hypothetical protein
MDLAALYTFATIGVVTVIVFVVLGIAAAIAR